MSYPIDAELTTPVHDMYPWPRALCVAYGFALMDSVWTIEDLETGR